MRPGSWQKKGRQNTWQNANRILFYFICLIRHCSERKGGRRSFLGLWFYLESESSETSKLKQGSVEGLVHSGIRTLQTFYNQAWVWNTVCLRQLKNTTAIRQLHELLKPMSLCFPGATLLRLRRWVMTQTSCCRCSNGIEKTCEWKGPEEAPETVTSGRWNNLSKAQRQ